MTSFPIIASLALGIWIYLVLFRGGFWLACERETKDQPMMPIAEDWPGVVAVIPYLVTNWFGITSLTISATGMLIVVGVVLDTMKQLEAQLLMRNYEGFIR